MLQPELGVLSLNYTWEIGRLQLIHLLVVSHIGCCSAFEMGLPLKGASSNVSSQCLKYTQNY